MSSKVLVTGSHGYAGTATRKLLEDSGYKIVEVAEKRFSICQSCPELVKLTSQCKKCGCFMAAKTKLLNATCPLGKW